MATVFKIDAPRLESWFARACTLSGAALRRIHQAFHIVVPIGTVVDAVVAIYAVGRDADDIVRLRIPCLAVPPDPCSPARTSPTARIAVVEPDETTLIAFDQPAELNLDDLALLDVHRIADFGGSAVLAPPAVLPPEISLIRAATDLDHRIVPYPLLSFVSGNPAVIGQGALAREAASLTAEVSMLVKDIRVPLPGHVVANAVGRCDQDAGRDELSRADPSLPSLVKEEFAGAGK